MKFSKLQFSLKVNLQKCTSFEEEKSTRYVWRNVYFDIIVFSCLSSTKPFPRDNFYQNSLENEVNFTYIDFPKYVD